MLSMAMTNKLVKQCNKACSEDDMRLLSVVQDFSALLFVLIKYHVPCTAAQTGSGSGSTRETPDTVNPEYFVRQNFRTLRGQKFSHKFIPTRAQH